MVAASSGRPSMQEPKPPCMLLFSSETCATTSSLLAEIEALNNSTHR
jgi:hypothetical protein